MLWVTNHYAYWDVLLFCLWWSTKNSLRGDLWGWLVDHFQLVYGYLSCRLARCFQLSSWEVLYLLVSDFLKIIVSGGAWTSRIQSLYVVWADWFINSRQEQLLLIEHCWRWSRLTTASYLQWPSKLPQAPVSSAENTDENWSFSISIEVYS